MPEPQTSTEQAPPPPQGQTWDPVAELRSRYPGVANEPEEKIRQHLSSPQNFRSAFPEYAHLDDATITRNMQPKAAAIAKNAQPTEFEKERQPENQEGFFHHALKVLGSQLKGATESTYAPVIKGYEGYEQARGRGANIASSLAQGSLAGAKEISIIPGVPGTSASSFEGMAKGAGEYKERRGEGYGRVYSAAAPVAAPLVNVNLPSMEHQADIGNRRGVIAEAAVPAAEAAAAAYGGKAVKAAGKVTGLEPYATKLGNLGMEAVNKLRMPEAQKALTQAIQPGVNIPRAQESIAIAGPRIQQIRTANGVDIPAKGPEALKAVLDLNRQAKTQILSAIEDRMGPVADLRPTASAVAKGIRGAVDDLTLEQTPGAKESVERRAGTYEREGGNAWSIRQMEERMHTLNNRLASAYSKPTAGEAHLSVETEMDFAEARELRKLIDDSVEKLSGEGVKDLKREWGAQRDVEKSLARQYAIATRVKGAPLWEGLAYLQAAGYMVSGNLLGAAKAAATLAVGKRLATLRDAGALAHEAFQGDKAFGAAQPIPTHTGPPPPKGLLPKPATEAGFTGEDTSGPARGGRWTTPAALLPGEKPIEAEFVPRRVPPTPGRLGVNRMLPSGEPPATNIPPIPTTTRETTLPPDETRLGPTGEAGIRIPAKPIKGLLPETGGVEPPPLRTPKTPSKAMGQAAVKAAKEYKPSEKAATMSAPRKVVPEQEAQNWQEEINRNQEIIRNPRATAEEVRIARDRLRDAKEGASKAFGQKAVQSARP